MLIEVNLGRRFETQLFFPHILQIRSKVFPQEGGEKEEEFARVAFMRNSCPNKKKKIFERRKFAWQQKTESRLCFDCRVTEKVSLSEPNERTIDMTRWLWLEGEFSSPSSSSRRPSTTSTATREYASAPTAATRPSYSRSTKTFRRPRVPSSSKTSR